MLDGDHYILINLCNANTETETCKIFNELQNLLIFFDINQNKRIIFAGDFNIFFNSKLEARGSKPIPKRKSIIKLLYIKEKLNLCHIWRIRNPMRQNFTFRQNHSTGFIERRLVSIFVSNCLQEFVNCTMYYLPCQLIILQYWSRFETIILIIIVIIVVFGNIIVP